MRKYIGWRGSGKTQTILVNALICARAGKKVLIIVPTGGNTLCLSDRLIQLNGSYPDNIMLVSANRAAEVLQSMKFDEVYMDEMSLCVKNMFPKLVAVSDTNSEDF